MNRLDKSDKLDKKIENIFWFIVVLFIGGWSSDLNLLAPIHELGHILAAFFTNGKAWFHSWDSVYYYGGNDFVISLGGYYFELLAGTYLFIKIMKKFEREQKLKYRLIFAFIAGYFTIFLKHVNHGEDFIHLSKYYGASGDVTRFIAGIWAVLLAFSAFILGIAKSKSKEATPLFPRKSTFK